jgi:hypothetical protein
MLFYPHAVPAEMILLWAGDSVGVVLLVGAVIAAAGLVALVLRGRAVRIRESKPTTELAPLHAPSSGIAAWRCGHG